MTPPPSHSATLDETPAEATASGVKPYVPPVSAAPTKEILQLRLADPFRWLQRGAHDLWAELGLSAFYGMFFWLLALTLAVVFKHKPEYTMSIISGCFLVGPFMTMGLYEVSRRRELKLLPDLASSLTCWDKHMGSMGMLVLVLMLLELIWGRASLVVFAVFFNTGMPSTAGVVQAIFNPDNWEFVIVYLVVGGFFGALVFSTCVVAIPMILDRDTDAISAAITSAQVVLNNTLVMLLWGGLIIALVVVALCLPTGLGLWVVGPWLGYASWHAYRGSVKTVGSVETAPTTCIKRR